MKIAAIFILVCAGPFIASSKPFSDSLIIGKFDTPADQQGWTLIKDSGTRGKLDFTSGETNRSARLTWDVTTGGRWNGAQKRVLRIPPDVKGIRLRIKCSGASTTWLFLQDTNGKRYKYRITRSLTDLVESKWFSSTISFSTLADSTSGGAFSPNIQEKLQSIMVVIEPRMDPWYPQIRWIPQPKGEMWFDDVEWVTNYIEHLKRIDHSSRIVPASVLWNRVGVCTHFEGGDFSRPDLIKSLGFSLIRADIQGRSVEKIKGKYDFSYFDTKVDSAEQYDLSTLLILDYSNPLYTTDNAAPATEAERQAFARYCSVAARYFKGRAVDFEIWNEPNLRASWKPGPHVVNFSKLLALAVDSVKSADPLAKVITAGTAGIDWRFIDSLGMLGALKRVDGLGIHPYRMGSPESISEDLMCLRWLAKKYFKAYPPEWSTECGAASSNYGNGFADSSLQWQARIDVRTILSNWMAGFACSIKYEFFTKGNDPNDNECNYGIICPDLEKRPAYYAIQALKRMTENRRWVGRLNTKNSGAHALQFDGDNNDLLVLWTSTHNLDTDKTGYKTHFYLYDKPIAVYNLLGNQIACVADATLLGQN